LPQSAYLGLDPPRLWPRSPVAPHQPALMGGWVVLPLAHTSTLRPIVSVNWHPRIRVHSAFVELPQEAFRQVPLRGSRVSRPSYSAAPRRRTPFSYEDGLVFAALSAQPALVIYPGGVHSNASSGFRLWPPGLVDGCREKRVHVALWVVCPSLPRLPLYVYYVHIILLLSS
jgi:hypothetical protein